jgi:hypothetical protein
VRRHGKDCFGERKMGMGWLKYGVGRGATTTLTIISRLEPTQS